MKKTIISVMLFFGVAIAFAQKGEMIQSVRSVKTTEPNRTADGGYNLSSKNDDQRLLFGDFNAPAEFLFAPSFDGISGWRIYRDSVGRDYRLEVKRVTNWEEVNDSIKTKFVPDLKVRTITLAQWEEQKKQMKAAQERRREEWQQLQRARTASVSISDTLADKLKAAITEAIERVKPVEKKAPKSENVIEIVNVITDGDSAIFRCIVGDQLWTLDYHVPEGEFKTLSDLFRSMIADIEARTFDEAKYIRALR